MKLELKHISGYLPYGLKCQVIDQGKKKIAELTGIYSDCSCVFFDAVESEKGFSEVKPLLRPMSDLYKEIDGVVHIVELAKIVCKICEVEFEPDFTTIKHYEGHSIVVKCKKWESEFWYIVDGYFYFEYNGDIMDLPQLDLFNYLFEHHFDIYSLIGKGLAIDINSLSQ